MVTSLCHLGVCNCPGIASVVITTALSSVLATLATVTAACIAVLVARKKMKPRHAAEHEQRVGDGQGDPMYEEISLEDRQKAMELEKNVAYGTART